MEPDSVILNRTLIPFFPAAIALTLALLGASAIPVAGQLAYGNWHWIAHFGAYAVLAYLWRRALPRALALGVAAAVVAFGFVQEAIEIAGHAHGIELADALVNAAGGALGVAAAHASSRRSD
ncbi:MAG: hypothetical protein ABI423_14505 [Burkholderiales bacterium]